MKQVIKINEHQIRNLVEAQLKKVIKEESIDKAINEGVENKAALKDVVLKLYDFGAELNVGKNTKGKSIHGIGSVIMIACKQILELYTGEDMGKVLNSRFSDIANKKGGV